jgi:hypothetical protein
MQLTRDEILKQGFVDFRVTARGMIQNHKFVVKREKSPFGEIPFLVVNAVVQVHELSRVAEALQLPIRSGSAVAFPKGKMAKDFAGL